MTVLEEGPRLRDEEVLPLMHTLQLEHNSSSNGNISSSSSSSKQGLLQRLRGMLRGLTPELLAIALVYFVQGILKLSSLAVTFFLKDHLHMEPTQMALAETITAVPWTVKPLYGFITDSFPILGMRRRPYLILAGLLGSAAWLCMAGLANSVPTALACITTAALSTAFSDVVADSIVVQLARASPGATEGALQSMCWGAHAFGRVITAYLSGWLVGKAGPRPVFLATASFPLIVCASSCLINESAGGTASKHSTAQHAAAAGADTDNGVNSSSGSGSRNRGAGGGGAAEQQQLLAAGTDRTPTAAAGGFAAAAVQQQQQAVMAAAEHVEHAGTAAHHHHSSMGSRQDSAEVLMASQLQLAPAGHLHHKHRNSLQQQHGYSHPHPLTPTAGDAAAAAADDTTAVFGRAGAGVDDAAAHSSNGWGLAGNSSSSRSGGGTGKHKGRGCLAQAWLSMGSSVRLFWNAIKQPHMLRPVLFLFLLQAMPQPDSAMFYFKTNRLGFDAEFFGRVKLVAALADLAGLAVYNTFLKSARLRPMMLWGALLGCAVGLTPLLLVEGVNRKLGISDRLFAMVDSAILASIGQVLMMPTLVLCARLCPEGVEATLYASLMSLNNAAMGTAALLGAGMMRLFGITSTNFDHLSLLLLTCNLMSLLPLPLVGWVPDSSTQAATAAAAAAVEAGTEGGGEGCSRQGDMELGAVVQQPPSQTAAAAGGGSRVRLP